jgi:MinD-like ATPase involved in chromosome partitioning or flagellar assembly
MSDSRPTYATAERLGSNGSEATNGQPEGPRHASESAGPMRAQIRQAELVTPYRPRPATGWRKTLHRRTHINLGPSPSERAWKDLERRVKTNLRGTFLIAVMQQKGGVSKTVTTVGIGAALAHYRTDKVVAIDANPAHGNLSERIDEPAKDSWWNLINDPDLNAYSDFRFHLGKDSTSGLEVLASDPGDRVMTGVELTEAWKRLQRQYPVGLVDCGNQLNDDITSAILGMVDAVVIVSTTGLDGARGAQDTVNWLLAHGYPHLVRSAVVVISNVSKVPAGKAVRNLHEDFERVVRAVHAIPYDPHLHEATAVSIDRLKPATRRAFVEAAASVADAFAGAADKDSKS